LKPAFPLIAVAILAWTAFERLCCRAHARETQEEDPSGGDSDGVICAYFDHWFDRVERTQAEQPHWMTPLVTVTPRLEEEIRWDALWQVGPAGKNLLNLGGGKGLELIPWEPVEIILGVPPYLVHWGAETKPPMAWGTQAFY
jgi:hypothetical protein